MFIESPANLELLGLLFCQALAANSACMMGAFQANAEGCVVAGTSEGEQMLQYPTAAHSFSVFACFACSANVTLERIDVF